MRDLLLESLLARVDLQLGQVPGQATDGGRVGAVVVVEHDHQIGRLQVRDLVQRLVGSAAGEGAVAESPGNLLPGRNVVPFRCFCNRGARVPLRITARIAPSDQPP